MPCGHQERISATLTGAGFTTVAFLSGIAFALRKGSPSVRSLPFLERS